MAKEYKVGEKYYLPVAVFTTDARSIDPIGLKVYTGNGNTGAMYLSDEPDLLLTADEIATTINTERAEVMENLGNHNLELSKQNEELSARVEELTDLTNYYMAERRRDKMNIRLLLDKIAELEGEKNG